MSKKPNPEGYPCGLYRTFITKKCRCVLCKKAAADYRRNLRHGARGTPSRNNRQVVFTASSAEEYRRNAALEAADY